MNLKPHTLKNAGRHFPGTESPTYQHHGTPESVSREEEDVQQEALKIQDALRTATTCKFCHVLPKAREK